MASFFRKLGHNIAPFFRKLPGEFSRIGRKVSHFAGDVQHGLDKANNFLGKIDRYAPNPILKIARGVIGGASGVAGGVSRGGAAIDQLGQGHFSQAGRLGMQGLSQIGKGAGDFSKGATQAAPYLLPLL